ncbi:MAG: hypothetical protein Q4C83_00245 [Candidatus Saccharibacteria bacterium]|nr:hypothetical protein [Candidatus Saccharibacteria bacterium]
MRNMTNNLWVDKPAGELFEHTMIRVLKNVYKENPRAVVDYTGTRRDTHEGTDCTLMGIPLDITLNYEGKDKINNLVDTFELTSRANGCGELLANVKFGIRLGNRHAKFRLPVLVFGVSLMPTINFWRYEELIYDALRRDMRSMFDRMQDKYLDYCEKTGAEV